MLRNFLKVYFMKVMNYFLNRNASGFQIVGDTLAGCLHKRVGRRGVLGKNQELFCKNFVKGSPSKIGIICKNFIKGSSPCPSNRCGWSWERTCSQCWAETCLMSKRGDHENNINRKDGEHFFYSDKNALTFVVFSLVELSSVTL